MKLQTTKPSIKVTISPGMSGNAFIVTLSGVQNLHSVDEYMARRVASGIGDAFIKLHRQYTGSQQPTTENNTITVCVTPPPVPSTQELNELYLATGFISMAEYELHQQRLGVTDLTPEASDN